MTEALAAIDPALAAALAAAGVLGAAGLLGALLARAFARRRAPVARRIEALAAGQHQLAGAIAQLAEAQLAAQARLTDSLSARLERAEGRMGETLAATARRTAHGLGALGQRIAAVDRAQDRMRALSEDLVGLQRILADKQSRGLFGEIQLQEILRTALPAGAWRAQPTLSNGRRPDAVIALAGPPGAIAVDAKFPLEAYEALHAAREAPARRRAEAALRSALAGHIRDVADRYVLPGETADQALLFVPSEAVFAELHARCGEALREGFSRRVWVVGPTTLMALLSTLRGVARDARISAEAAAIARELGLLRIEIERMGEAAETLERHLGRAGAAMAPLRLSLGRARDRAALLVDREVDGEMDGEMDGNMGGGPVFQAPVPETVSAPATGANPSNSGGPR